MTKLKICRVGDISTARMLAWMGVHYQGLHAIDPDQTDVTANAVGLNRRLLAECGYSNGVLLTKSSHLEWVDTTLRAGGFRLLQMHVHLNGELLQAVRSLCDTLGVQLILMVDPRTDGADYIAAASAIADFPLFDHRLGGTGFEIEESLLATFDMRRAFLAGGIDATNIESKRVQFNPYAFDVQSYVETHKFTKDFQRVRALLCALENGPYLLTVPASYALVSMSLTDLDGAALRDEIAGIYDGIDAFHVDHADGSVDPRFVRDCLFIAEVLAACANEKPYDLHLFVSWGDCALTVDRYLARNFRMRVAYKHVERFEPSTAGNLQAFEQAMKQRGVQAGVAIQATHLRGESLGRLLDTLTISSVREVSIVGPSEAHSPEDYRSAVLPVLRRIRDLESSSNHRFAVGLDRSMTLPRVEALRPYRVNRVFVGKFIRQAGDRRTKISELRAAMS